MQAELTLDAVFDAYFDCRRTKRNSISQLRFETELETNLVALYRDLRDGHYHIGRSIAFVVTHPKIREVWAADFRDRIVHHLIYRAVAPRFIPRFIRDSYACIPGRGTHDGLRRVAGFARSITHNWSRPAYALKLDIANFFNSIDRFRLLDLLAQRIPEPWLHDLVRSVVLHDPRTNAERRSPPSLFAQVPRHKSLLFAADGVGLPIGNLTSQFFANVYLNELDQFVKHTLHARCYARYVDDMILLHDDPAVLSAWALSIDGFLQQSLALHLHPRKTHLNLAANGINFIGFIIKPGRIYLRRSTIDRCRVRIANWERCGRPLDSTSLHRLASGVTSYLGMLRQVDGYRSRQSICARVDNLFIRPDPDLTKITVIA